MVINGDGAFSVIYSISAEHRLRFAGNRLEFVEYWPGFVVVPRRSDSLAGSLEYGELS